MAEEEAFQIDSPIGAELVDFENRNTKSLRCPLCSGNVLPAHAAILTDKTIKLPTMESLASNAEEGESLQWYWQVDDMWKFDNLGFTKAIPGPNGELRNFRYVICGCCEKGIMGIQHLGTDDNNIYVGHNRVSYH